MALVIKKEKAIKLFKYLGYKTAENWDDKQLAKKLKNLEELTEGVKIKNPKVKKFLTKILNADSIRIKSAEDSKTSKENKKMSKKKKKKNTAVEEEVVDKKKKSSKKSTKNEGKKKKSSKKTSEKTSKNVDKKKVAKKSSKKATKDAGSNKDEFGCRIGTIKAKINAALSTKPRTMEMLLKRAKVENPQTGHLNDLIKAGHVIRGDKGYQLVK